MSGNRFLLDSVIVIDHLNGVSAATDLLSESYDYAISAITRAEVLTGVGPKKIKVVKALLETFALIAIDKAIADRAAMLRRQHRWKLPDAIQAAAALESEMLLVTRNTKDFRPARDKFVYVPYELG